MRQTTRSGIVVVVPARDEGSDLADALLSLNAQTLRPDRIIVVVNNSTDHTEGIAYSCAALPDAVTTEVLVMPGRNPHRKSGALNFGLRHLIGYRRHIDDGASLPSDIRYVLVMDGDTELESHFCERARKVLQRNSRLGGVSAACLGKPTYATSRRSQLLQLFQRIEYGRFASTRLRRNVHTMSGAGSFYRVSALNELLSVRKNVFEERIGNLVEDYETTLALKQLGWRITSNQQCIAYTGLMPKLGMLLDQRIRWLRGTIDEWRRYGWCRVTWLSIIGMLSALLGIGYAAIWTVISVHSVVAHHGHIDPRYLLLFAFWSCYQAYQVRHMGWRIVLFEAVLLPEVAFNVLRNYWLVRSIAASYFTRTHNHLGWN